MKKQKLLGAAAALTLVAAGQTFAYDAKASIKLNGSLAAAQKGTEDGAKTDLSFLSNNPRAQKDDPDDGIEIDLDAGLAGAHLALWYKTATDDGQDTNEGDDWSAYFRRTYVWFKPIDMLKIQAGYVGNDTFFHEKIDDWKVGSPFAVAERDWVAHPAYISNADVEGWGFGAELRPIEPLVITAGITPTKGGFKSDENEYAAITKKGADDHAWVAPWGVGAIYYWDKFEFQASYRNGGLTNKTDKKSTWSVARFGAGYKDESVQAFIQPILGFDYNDDEDKTELNGVCFDLYGEYYLDAWTFQAHVPVTLRFSDADNDYNYLEWVAVAKYNLGSHGNLDDLSPYVKVGSNWNDGAYDVKYRVWLLDGDYFKDTVNASFAGGVNFKVSSCEIDVAVQLDLLSDLHKSHYKQDWMVSIPFSMEISF